MVPAKFVIGKRARTPEEEGASSSESSRASWNTTRSDVKPVMSYASRLTITMTLTTLMTVVILVSVLAFVWEGQFQKYTHDNMVRLAEATAETLGEQYDSAGGWTEDVLSHANSASSSSSDVGIQVLNEEGDVIYDDTWAKAATATTGSSSSGTSANTVPTTTDSSVDLSGGKVSLAPTSTDSIVSAEVTNEQGQQVGTVRVWAFGSDALLTKSDAAFRTSSYNAIAVAAVLAVLLSVVVGFFVSRTLTNPIKRITSTASQIRNGDLTARTGLKGDDEIGRLGETFDDMASSLERDLKLEHRLTSDVAHELRTPLMAMLATVEAMQDGVLPCDEERLATVSGEVRRLSRLVDAMLKLSRMENGTTAFNPERTDMVGLVGGLVSSQEQLFADQDLKLRLDVELPHKECYASVDRDMMRQALVNLMSNAMRYTPEGGWVVVKVSQDRSDVLISVSDTGIGIAKDDLSKVFGRFWRSDASRERVSGGLGVGLALTKEIIDRHHGFISVESEENKGTTFTLHLPREHRQISVPGQSVVGQRRDAAAPRTAPVADDDIWSDAPEQ